MSEYPDTSPWGPHGPQVPAHSVTPNPTAPSPISGPGPTPFGQPDSQPGYPGGGTDRLAGPVGLKSMKLAVILSAFFGPLGLIYAMWGTPSTIPAMLFIGASVLVAVWYPSIPWVLYPIISVVYSVRIVRSWNKQFAKS